MAGAMMARKGLIADGRLRDGPAALRGLRLSTDRTGPPFFFVDTLLGSAGLTLDDVLASDIEAPARGEALALSLIDVTMAFEPAVTQMLDSGAAEIWIPARDIVPDFQYTFLLFGPRLLAGDRDAGRRFLRAYLAAVERYLDEGKSSRIVEILARHTRLDPDLLRRACWPATARDGGIDAASLERYQAWALEEGLIDARLDLAKLVDTGFLDRAGKSAGSAGHGATATSEPVATAAPVAAVDGGAQTDRVWYDSVTVTAARIERDRTEVPANVTVLGGDQVRESAALSLDALLRQVPGFGTLGQQSNLVSSVQAQSVSLRGLGGTSTSRTLVLLDGADLQRIAIEHHQDLTFRSGRFVERADVEGRQDLAGAFVQDVFTPGPRWSVQAGARADHIRSFDGESISSDRGTGAVTASQALDEHSETTINPSFGAVFQASGSVSLRASTYTGFRAPTPAELYKGFRTGATVVEANSGLEPERLHGAELGAAYGRSSRFFGRVTGFWNELQDLIVQTTVGAAGPAGAVIPPCGAIAPRGVCRQRNNVGRVRAVGLELEGE